MDLFNSWILTVVGGSIVLTLFELILPIGKMNLFLKSIMGIFYVYIIFLPIINLFKSYL